MVNRKNMKTTEKKYESDNRTGMNNEGRLPNLPVKRLTATSIVGDDIVNQHDEKLGKIDNLMINIKSGQVEYAIIEFGSFIGIGGKLFAIPFAELRVDPAKQRFILEKDKDYLKESPGFDKGHWPDTNDHSYFENVRTYYKALVLPFSMD